MAKIKNCRNSRRLNCLLLRGSMLKERENDMPKTYNEGQKVSTKWYRDYHQKHAPKSLQNLKTVEEIAF